MLYEKRYGYKEAEPSEHKRHVVKKKEVT